MSAPSERPMFRVTWAMGGPSLFLIVPRRHRQKRGDSQVARPRGFHPFGSRSASPLRAYSSGYSPGSSRSASPVGRRRGRPPTKPALPASAMLSRPDGEIATGCAECAGTWFLVRCGRSRRVPPRTVHARRRRLVDFHIGYLGTAIVALCFLLMGAGVMHGAGQRFPDSAGAFAGQVISLYASTLGEWSHPLIGNAPAARAGGGEPGLHRASGGLRARLPLAALLVGVSGLTRRRTRRAPGRATTGPLAGDRASSPSCGRRVLRRSARPCRWTRAPATRSGSRRSATRRCRSS